MGFKMSYKYLIQSNSLHSGGGATLLNSLLGDLDDETFVFIDKRHRLNNPKFRFMEVKPNLVSRLISEYRMRKLSDEGTRNLILTNLPPIFKLRGKTVLMIQNVKLLHFGGDRNYGVKVFFRLYLERIWLRCFIKNVDRVIVQSRLIENRVQKLFGKQLDTKVVAFAPSLDRFHRGGQDVKLPIRPVPKFIYIASADPHKNHMKLIDAWIILARNNIYPVLAFTLDVDTSSKLIEHLQFCTKKYNLKIKNLGWLTQSEVMSIYPEYDCLVYPSKTESFGLPLIEARTSDLDIVASELDYVRELVDPEETFNPESAVSIARAICRYSNLEFPNAPIIETKTLLFEAFKNLTPELEGQTEGEMGIDV